MQAKSSVVFGEFAGQVREKLAAFGDEVGRSRFELEGMAASIQDTFVPMGFARGEASELSIQLTKLATDVASFNNASDTETMAAFQSALVGNHETVRRFGIVITEATLQQELLRMGINKSAKEVTNAEKVQARLNLIMAGTTDAQGDAARTADSFANRTKALNAELEQLGVELGNTLMPAFLGLTNFIIEATKKFREFLQAIGLTDLPEAEQKVNDLTKKIKELSEIETDIQLTERLIELEKQSSGMQKVFQMLAGEKGFFGLGVQALTTAEQVALVRTALFNINLDDALGTAKQKAAQLTSEIIRLKNEAESAGGPPNTKPKDLGLSPTGRPERDAEKVLKNLRDENQLLDIQVKSRSGVSQATLEMLRIKQTLDAHPTDLSAIQEELQLQELLNQKLRIQNDEREYAQGVAEAYFANQENIKESLVGLNLENEILKAKVDGATEAELRFLEISSQLPEMNKYQEESLKALIATNAELAEQLETDVNPMLEQLKDSAQRAGDSVANSLADGLVEGELSLNAFQDIFKQFIKELIAEAIRTYIIKQLLGSLIPSFGFAGGGAVSPAPSFGGGKAGGGSISSPVLVGERGPELFIPHSAGVVKNNMDTKNMLGGGGTINIYQTLNVETGVAQTVRAELANFAPIIKQDTIRAVAEARRRGGQFANAFGG